MTNLEFLKEEYLTLRKEIEDSVSELASLERQCVLATAGVYTWLATSGLKGEVVTPCVEHPCDHFYLWSFEKSQRWPASP